MRPLSLGRVVLLASGLAALVMTGRLGLDLYRADHALRHAESGLVALRSAVAQGEDARTSLLLRGLQADARSARRATDGPLWASVSLVPWLGDTAAGVVAVTRSVDDVATGVLPVLLGTTGDLRRLGSASGDHVDLAALTSATPALATAQRRMQDITATLDRTPGALVLPPVGRARDRVAAGLHTLTSDLGELAAGSRLLPDMLGRNGPRRYFVAFQNNAEARGTGGLVGAYAVLEADRGKVRVAALGSDRDLEGLPSPRLDLGRDFQALYGQDLQAWQNANMTAHFPSAARLWLDMWQQRTGQRLDGALATDPIALEQVLGVTGPVPVAGASPLTAGNVVYRTESEPYARYAGHELARKDFLLVSARAVLARVLGPQAPSRLALAKAIAAAAGQRRVMLYSAHPEEQAWISGAPLAGEVPSHPGPFAFLVVNNTAGNKIDYYLDRSLRYDLHDCRGSTRSATVTAVLRDDLPPGPLPPVVAGRLDRPAGTTRRGSTSLLVSVYVATGAQVRRATVDGRPAAVFVGREQGHPVIALHVELVPNRPSTVTLELTEQVVRSRPVVPVQSLVRPQLTTVRARTCS